MTHDAKTDPAPPYTLLDLAGMIEDLRSRVQQGAQDQEILLNNIYTAIGTNTEKMEALVERYGQVVARLATFEMEFRQTKFNFSQTIGAAADAVSKTVSIKDFIELKRRVEVLEENKAKPGVGDDVDEERERASREIGSGSR